jgi:hypothetical protein
VLHGGHKEVFVMGFIEYRIFDVSYEVLKECSGYRVNYTANS